MTPEQHPIWTQYKSQFANGIMTMQKRNDAVGLAYAKLSPVEKSQLRALHANFMESVRLKKGREMKNFGEVAFLDLLMSLVGTGYIDLLKEAKN